MKERPVLMSTENVKAILEDRKTQTRRVIKPQPTINETGDKWVFNHKDGVHWWWIDEKPVIAFMRQFCPYGQVGDRLWVRETFCCHSTQGIVYKADFPDSPLLWKPSIHLFRADSRIDLEITDIRVERLQEITEDDAIAEGIEKHTDSGNNIFWYEITSDYHGSTQSTTPIEAYMKLWDSINAKPHWVYTDMGKLWHSGYSWESNPFVWVISFKRVR